MIVMIQTLNIDTVKAFVLQKSNSIFVALIWTNPKPDL